MGDYIKLNSDLHIHGLYSGAVSSKMVPSVIAEQAPFKGLDLIGTGDILNARWVKLVKEQLKPFNDSILEHSNGTKFLLQTEVEDNQRVHHIIFFPNFSKVEEVKEKLKSKCKNLDIDGRPKVWLNGEELAELCLESDCSLGYAHAFTPYFGLLAKFNSYKDCYGKYWKNIHFLELGLSADTNMADRISELHNLTFLSNSDAHSPWPNKMGREFNELIVKEITFDETKKAIKRINGRKCTLNVGFNPLEGKYHKTRCIGCLSFYEPTEAIKLNWRCSNCGKPIKKGVDFRIEELSDVKEGTHPEHRPEYKHIIPLNEIIALAMNINQATSVKVQAIWQKFIKNFKSEINILLKEPMENLKKLDENVAKYIQFFRDEKIKYIPGGAGVYGKLVRPGEEIKIEKPKIKQKSLTDF